MTPRVSILLPVWNAGKTLASCLRSLERQRETGWESVLVATLNAGAEACPAPLVARMDADDWMHRDRLALQCALLDREPGLDAVGASCARSRARA